ncbi:hypothetical protein [Peribacillus asahii]|uniref:hypothetical protein n=1 Tax=Peribacillus asahii TaxID=228899 RepID=UPI002079EBD3|nr:hypothetical protein [Peribacillus asahii]USK62183.1 hypothetical protein LIT37_23690 [Peribacillus asahii]
MLIVNKGISFGWNPDELMHDKTRLGFTLFSVLACIMESWKPEGGLLGKIETSEVQLEPQYKGLIKEACLAMENDFHGLATHIDMINFIYDNRRGSLSGKDFLYATEVFEKYFANMRSIYDFMAKIVRLTVEQTHIKGLGLAFDSLNDLIKSVEKGKHDEKYPERLKQLLMDIKDSFLKVRGIRDYILHNGKQLRVMTKDDGYYIGLSAFSKDNQYDNFVPALPYLLEITKEMISFGEELGLIIHEEYTKRYGNIPFTYVAFEGQCIPSFIKFLEL